MIICRVFCLIDPEVRDRKFLYSNIGEWKSCLYNTIVESGHANLSRFDIEDRMFDDLNLDIESVKAGGFVAFDGDKMYEYAPNDIFRSFINTNTGGTVLTTQLILDG